ncbi:tRNA adenosine deaminase-associated protein [Amycolatopsis pithecellobii]|uniref:tRNA adenosine deaminase n=1 Tax=Amycolatopsis pithecellobii TaxID=664692 RepID=A0A6N7Z9M3_9PSEU|nr:tRNA adenosine deaminase-associated protein [Amycolatopsis pithecellobii]MTD58437.1 tRNA adenosine deaminase [Amycolatopsis pithecellobii]
MSVKEPVAGFAVAVVREDGRWRCSALEPDALTNLDAAITALGKLRSTGAVFALLAVDDEFFVIVRPSPRGPSLLLSDATAALDYDIAADVLDVLRVDFPDDAEESIWPEGDLEILADVGLPAPELEVIAGEVDLYPDEQMQMIAQRCGFADEFGALLDEI